VIGISQSGESPDVVAVVEEARRQGRPTIALTNTPASPLGLAADHVLKIEAGDERAVAATKTYVNSLGAIALLFAATTGDSRALAELRHAPAWIEQQLGCSLSEQRDLEPLAASAGATVVARGINYCTAHEVALKIREVSGLHVESYSAADLMHGPIAAIGPSWAVVVVAPAGPAFAALAPVVDETVRRGARLVVLSDDPALRARAELGLELVGGVPEWLSPLVAVVPGQVTALRLARLRGIDVDSPLGLTKVTLTR